MITRTPKRCSRARFQGARQILRLNWPWYALALGLCLVGGGLLGLAPLPLGVALGLAAGAGAAAAWGILSLMASHWIYDRSGIYDLAWLAGLLQQPPACWVNVHAGLDETSPALCALFPAAESRVLDIHDPASMSEPAIARARRLGTPDQAATPANPRRLPLPDAPPTSSW